MLIKNEDDILGLIRKDKWMMGLLECADSLGLPDWWICAGFVRSKVWDVLHGYGERTVIPDIDLIYYNQKNIEKSDERKHEEELKKLLPTIPWSVKNQARMHIVNTNIPPYSSSADAISKFPETATAFGVKLDERNNLILTAPHGIEDLVNFKVKPTPFFQASKDRMLIYENRIKKKDWQSIWYGIEVMGSNINKSEVKKL